MYTKEELEKRFFTADRERWIEAASKDYLLKEEAKAQAIENGIILPARQTSESNSRAGGVCDERFNFVTGDDLQGKAASIDDGEGLDYIPETVIFGGGLTTHFGHAILGSISRLWYAVESNGNEKIAFISSEDIGSLAGRYETFLELLDIDLKRIIYIEKPTQFKRVIVPDVTAFLYGDNGQYKEKYTVVHEKMMSRVKAKSSKKIYLTRSQLPKHDCLGEEYFEEFYKRRGYNIVAPEQLALKDQIAYIKGADEIACTLGTLSHLALFARPGTKMVALLRSRENPPIIQQMIVNQAKQIDFYAVDVSFNFLPHSWGLSQCYLLGVSRHWKEYLKATGEKCAEDELDWEMRKYVLDYLIKWTSVASTYRGWTDVVALFDNFDFLNSLSTVLLDKPLKREGYPGSFKEKEKALLADIERLRANIASPDINALEAQIARLQEENKSLKAENDRLKNSIEGIKNTTSWKITQPLRKHSGFLNGRARSIVLSLLNRRGK